MSKAERIPESEKVSAEPREISRREFLRRAVIFSSATAIGLSGAGEVFAQDSGEQPPADNRVLISSPVTSPEVGERQVEGNYRIMTSEELASVEDYDEAVEIDFTSGIEISLDGKNLTIVTDIPEVQFMSVNLENLALVFQIAGINLPNNSIVRILDNPTGTPVPVGNSRSDMSALVYGDSRNGAGQVVRNRMNVQDGEETLAIFTVYRSGVSVSDFDEILGFTHEGVEYSIDRLAISIGNDVISAIVGGTARDEVSSRIWNTLTYELQVAPDFRVFELHSRAAPSA